MTGRGREAKRDGGRSEERGREREEGGWECRKENTNREIQLYSGNIAAESEV